MRSLRRDPQVGAECGAGGSRFSEKVSQHHTEKVLTGCEIGGCGKKRRELLSCLFRLSQGNARGRHEKPEAGIFRMAHEVRLGVSQGRARTVRVQANPNEKMHCPSFRVAPRHRRDGILLGPHGVPERLALPGALVELSGREGSFRCLGCTEALTSTCCTKNCHAQHGH